MHGNTKIVGKVGKFDRLSMVCYFREGMLKCGTREEELLRAKKHGMFITKELNV